MRTGGDSFDDVFGSAIANAVRAAVDTVGRSPLAELENHGMQPAPAPVAARGTATVEVPPSLPRGTTDETDPYVLLGVSRAASWDDITAAYKRRARAWHPDGADPDEAARRQDLIRQLNMAYTELRVRRGR
jgi:hypothetical protein